jgi:hypothetical protein
MIIVKPLIINVMMEKNYQLVAWTQNITDNENARLYMIPSLKCEVEASLIDDLKQIHREEYKFDGPISIDLARRAIKACENMSRFKILAGDTGAGIRYLFFAAKYCCSCSDFHRELRQEFVRLCEEGTRLAKKFKREDILLESKPKEMLELCF